MVLESRRAQASASVTMTSAMVSVPMDQHSAIEVAQYHVSSLQGDLSQMGLDSLWEKEKHGLYGPIPPLSHPLQFSFLYSIHGKGLLVIYLHPHGLGWAFHSRGLSALAGLFRSPGGV